MRKHYIFFLYLEEIVYKICIGIKTQILFIYHLLVEISFLMEKNFDSLSWVFYVSGVQYIVCFIFFPSGKKMQQLELVINTSTLYRNIT